MTTQTVKNELSQAIGTGGKRAMVLGVIAIILGLLAMSAPAITGLSIAILLGVVVTTGGVLRMIWAFQARSVGLGLLRFVLGALTLICGFAMLANPLFASGVLTILLSAYLFADGLSEMAAGLGLGFGNGGGWLLFAGVISIVMGGMIWAQYPLSGAWAMGILLGIKLIFIGLIMIMGGTAARAISKA
jgi:uncharacterized membrane protein HdeD (DUF308 family)